MNNLKAGVQKFGSNLSSMIMPNIAAFIAWGIFAALFIPKGYLPNEALAETGTAMQFYLLPALIAYSGGNMIYGHRGSVVSLIATMGVIGGASSIPMFIGAMIMGPCAAWVMKKFDDLFQSKVATGFEMLYNNFSAGIIGMLLAIFGFYAVGPIVSVATVALSSGVTTIVNLGLIPLANLIIDPAKVLFLNNAINFGVLTPIATQQVTEVGKSFLFLLEENPGPGLGVLLAYALFGKGSAKSSSYGAMIIHFVGGIHEIYFPYIMMKPLLLLAVMAGGVTGTFVFSTLNVGLTSPASPGSILAIMGVTAKGDHLGVLLGIAAATIVSFLVASAILKADKSTEEDFEESKKRVAEAKAESKGQKAEKTANAISIPTIERTLEESSINDFDRIIFACDAGMGSSAMGASLLKKKAKSLGLTVPITNTAIRNLEDDDKTLVITQKELTTRAEQQAPTSTHVSVDNFMDTDRYDEILEELTATKTTSSEVANEEKNSENPFMAFDTIIFAYDKNRGEAAMGASKLRNAFVKKGIKKDIKAQSITTIKDENNTLIVFEEGTEMKDFQQSSRLVLKDFLADKNYN